MLARQKPIRNCVLLVIAPEPAKTLARQKPIRNCVLLAIGQGQRLLSGDVGDEVVFVSASDLHVDELPDEAGRVGHSLSVLSAIRR